MGEADKRKEVSFSTNGPHHVEVGGEERGAWRAQRRSDPPGG
jgi:hypothetical protein